MIFWLRAAVSKRCRIYNVGTHIKHILLRLSIKHILLRLSMSKLFGSPTALLTASGLRG